MCSSDLQLVRRQSHLHVHFVAGGAHLRQAALGEFFGHKDSGHLPILAAHGVDSTVLYRLLTHFTHLMSHLFLSDE